MLKITILPPEDDAPMGKLAGVELEFHVDYPDPGTEDNRPSDSADFLLDGLKLLGCAIWERRDGTRTVSYPSRWYDALGERRTFRLLRPQVGEYGSQNYHRAYERLRDAILEAYAVWERQELLREGEPC